MRCVSNINVDGHSAFVSKLTPTGVRCGLTLHMIHQRLTGAGSVTSFTYSSQNFG